MTTRKIFVRAITLILPAILFAACGGGTSGSSGGGAGTTTPTTINTTTVEPLNPSAGTNWNDYVTSAGVACDPAVDTDCTNGGLQRVIYVADKTDCTGVTASDDLGVFDWSCEVVNGHARVVSTGFKTGKGISDLIDFTSGSWKYEKVTIDNNGTTFMTTPEYWWTNNIVVNNSGNEPMNAGEVHIVTQNTSAQYSLVNGVTLLIQNGVAVDPPANGASVIIAHGTQTNPLEFVWVEGTVDATNSGIGVSLSNAKFSTLNNLTVSSASQTGISLESSKYNTLRNIKVLTSEIGIYLHLSSYNTLLDITVAGNGNSSPSGIYLFNLSSNNVLTNVKATENDVGIFVSGSDSATFTDTDVAGNITGVRVNSSANSFTGYLRVGGGNTTNCDVTGGTAPGLQSTSCTVSGAPQSNTYGTDQSGNINNSDAILIIAQ